MISFANEGPDRKAAGCFRPSALGMTSLIILPEPTSSPLLTEMIGTSGGEHILQRHHGDQTEGVEPVSSRGGCMHLQTPAEHQAEPSQRDREGEGRAHGYAFQELAAVLDRDSMDGILSALYGLNKACRGNDVVRKCILLHVTVQLIACNTEIINALLELRVTGSARYRQFVAEYVVTFKYREFTCRSFMSLQT